MITEATEQLLHQFAYGCYTHGHYDKAEKVFRALTMMKPNNGQYWYGLGAALIASGDDVEAMRILEVAAAYSPEEVKPRLFLAECQARLGKRDEAINSLVLVRRLLQKKPDSALYEQMRLVERMVETW